MVARDADYSQIDWLTAVRYAGLEARVLAVLERALPEGHGRDARDGDEHYRFLARTIADYLGHAAPAGPTFDDQIASLAAVCLAWLDMRRHRAMRANAMLCDHGVMWASPLPAECAICGRFIDAGMLPDPGWQIPPDSV